MQARRDFDLAALTWDDSPLRRQLAADVGSAMLAGVSLQPHWRVLDFGCGTGLISLPWAARVASLTGADAARGMLATFLDKATRAGFDNVGTHWLADDGDDLPEGPFDLIVSSMTLHHVSDVPRLLGRLFSVLAPGGHVALADLDPDEGLFHSDNTGVFHSGFDRTLIGQWLADVGFADVEVGGATRVEKDTPVGPREFGIFLALARRPA